MPEPLDVPGGESSTADSMPMTVLIADDSEINRRLLQKLLARLGYEALVAHSGERVLELMREGPLIDLILMDINMDGISGVETTSRLRDIEGEDAPEPYVVAVTADMPASLQVECLQAGMNDWVHKPISTRTLLGVVRNAWEHRLTVRKAREDQEEADEEPQSGAESRENTRDAGTDDAQQQEVGTLDSQRFAMLLDLTENEVPLMRQLFGMFEKSLREKFSTIEEELKRENAEAAAKAAHAIKSSSLEIGAAKLRELAARAETEAREGQLEASRELSQNGPGLLERFALRFEQSLRQARQT
jgi:CheY-like chemotaxis protein